jgi:hypothetical protein
VQLRSLNFAVASLALAAFIPAQSWTEQGDAGDLPATAQSVAGNGALTQINGELPNGGDVDMYKINVTDFANFSVSSVGGATFDTQMWMFDLAGNGISFKDDDGPLQSTLTGQFLTGNGAVLIAISRYDSDALDLNNDQIWNDTPFAVERQPDGPGAANPVVSWSGSNSAAGLYSLFLTGAEFVDPAECFLMLGLNRWNFVYGNDPLLVEPILTIPMTLTALPVFNIPANTGFTGISLYTQALLFNPAMFPSDPMRVSPAIKFTIGVETVPYGSGSGLSLWNIGNPVVQPGGQIRVNFSID